LSWQTGFLLTGFVFLAFLVTTLLQMRLIEPPEHDKRAEHGNRAEHDSKADPAEAGGTDHDR